MRSLTSFADDQPRALDALRGAVLQGRLHHAYLLVGAHLDTCDELARAVALRLACQAPTELVACAQCPGCRKVLAGTHPDVIAIAPGDKGGIGIDMVRDAVARLALRPAEGGARVVIIHGADQMNAPAQNALLKTLEEPPPATCFLLTTRRLRSLLPTLRSRSQRLELAPASPARAAQALMAAGIADSVAPVLARLVGPNVASAQELLEQGLESVLATLGQALRPEATSAQILDVAADLGAERERADLALALFELHVRDALARRHGADSAQTCTAPWADATADLRGAAQVLQQVRQQQALHVNRTLALERALLTLWRRSTHAA